MAKSKTGQTYASYYGNDIAIEQTGNTGVDTVLRRIIDGFGNSTAISLSTRAFQVKPSSNSTQTSTVQNVGGSNILTVDTTNSRVLVGASQVVANTMYAYFGVSSTHALSAVAGTHYAVPFNSMPTTSATLALGTGANPDISYDVSSNATSDDLTTMLWYIPDDITVDQVYWFAGGSSSSGDVINIHLLSYTIDTDNGATSGDLSDGVVIAGGADKTSLGRSNIIYESIAPGTTDVDAGKVCILTFESDGTNSDYAINATVKYHIR